MGWSDFDKLASLMLRQMTGKHTKGSKGKGKGKDGKGKGKFGKGKGKWGKGKGKNGKKGKGKGAKNAMNHWETKGEKWCATCQKTNHSWKDCWLNPNRQQPGQKGKGGKGSGK